MNNYTDIRRLIDSNLERIKDERVSYITHYLQNHKLFNGLYLKEPAEKYIPNFNQLKLPIKWDIPFPPPPKHNFTFIDLFAGIGGFRFGLQSIGGKCVFSSDIDKHASDVYDLNFGEFPFGDLTKINKNIIPTHDVLTAGFPCQPFSISGLKKGFEDARGTLIYEVFEIIKLRSPKVVFLENVKHLIHHDKGRTLKLILKTLKELGYFVSHSVLNANDFGIPQNRERLVIIASKKAEFNFNKITKKTKPILKKILEKEADFEFLEKKEYTLIANPKKQSSGLIFCGYRNKKIRKVGVRPNTEHLSRVHKQPNRIYSSEGTHPTLPSQETAGRFWIEDKGKVRKLTINECYRIMGFPDCFIKSSIPGERYKQIGNSVAIPMIIEVGKEVKKQLLKKQYG